MVDFHDPDETRRVTVAAHEVVTYSWGARGHAGVESVGLARPIR